MQLKPATKTCCSQTDKCFFKGRISIAIRANKGVPCWLSGKEFVCNADDSGEVDSIPGSGRSPGEGNGNLLQYSCLGNPIERGAWWATVYGVRKTWR